MVMSQRVNLYEAKARLSHWVDEAQAGRPVVIGKRNRPVAVLLSADEPRHSERQIGLAKGTFTTPASFFESLPEPLVSLFEGR